MLKAVCIGVVMFHALYALKLTWHVKDKRVREENLTELEFCERFFGQQFLYYVIMFTLVAFYGILMLATRYLYRYGNYGGLTRYLLSLTLWFLLVDFLVSIIELYQNKSATSLFEKHLTVPSKLNRAWDGLGIVLFLTTGILCALYF